MSLPLDEMTLSEKLQALEEIWADLGRAPESVPVPPWHYDLLGEREQRVRDGVARFEDWASVKQRLRDRTQ